MDTIYGLDTGTINGVLDFWFRNKTVKPDYGCLPCDALYNRKVTRYPVCYVVNDQPAREPGHHWVAIYIEGPDRPMEFFCSFGVSIDNYSQHFTRYAITNNLRVNQCEFDLQSIESKFCGHHALYFLYKRMNNCKFTTFYAQCEKRSPKENDAIVSKFIRKYTENPHIMSTVMPRNYVCKNTVRARRAVNNK